MTLYYSRQYWHEREQLEGVAWRRLPCRLSTLADAATARTTAAGLVLKRFHKDGEHA